MLEFKNVSTFYGKIQALHDVSLHINQGEIVTLIGANGAGKTTLLMTLCGDPKPQSGQIRFEDQDISTWHTSKIMRGDIAIVPEGRRIFSRLTVEENLYMGAFLSMTSRSSSACWQRCTNCSRGCANGCTSEPAPCRAVSSRCWRLAGR